LAAVSSVLGPVVANSLGLILWRPRPGRFSSEVRCGWTIRTLVEISEESRQKPPDYLHLTAKGYRLWADAMEPTLWRLLDEPRRKD
jgi:lysophospholipase L1-like esterase